MLMVYNSKVIGKCLCCGKLITEKNTYFKLDGKFNTYLICKDCYERGEYHGRPTINQSPADNKDR